MKNNHSELSQLIAKRFKTSNVKDVVVDAEFGCVTATIDERKNVDAGFYEEYAVPVTLPGVWAINGSVFVKEYNDGTAFIEAQHQGFKLLLKAKTEGMIGGVMKAVMEIDVREVNVWDSLGIDNAITALEASILAAS